jgi:hypothetical protein
LIYARQRVHLVNQIAVAQVIRAQPRPNLRRPLCH